MNIDNVYLNPPLLLVEKEQIYTNGLNEMVVCKTNENSKYKVGETILVEKGRLMEWIVDGEISENKYYLNEEFVKGYVSIQQ